MQSPHTSTTGACGPEPRVVHGGGWLVFVTWQGMQAPHREHLVNCFLNRPLCVKKEDRQVNLGTSIYRVAKMQKYLQALILVWEKALRGWPVGIPKASKTSLNVLSLLLSLQPHSY